MSEQKLRIVKAELAELTEIVAYWEGKRNEKYNEAVELVGVCPLCQNHHYPHCGAQDT
jgi:hypothetical protein